MSKWRRLLVPGVMTAVMLAVLIGLGMWQLQRLQWKRGLLAQFIHRWTFSKPEDMLNSFDFTIAC